MKMRSLVSAVALLALSASVTIAGEVRLFSWEAYFGADSIKKFEAESGNTVTYDVFDSNDMVETRVLAGNSGYDVVTPNLSPHLARQIPLKAWSELDKSKLSNIGNLDPELLAKVGEADPGDAHALRFTAGNFALSMSTKRSVRNRVLSKK